jgi:hypothetical protein
MSAIIHEYARQSALQAPQSISERMRTLALLFTVHLSAIANVRDVLGNPTDNPDEYLFQLIVAGYDTDNKLKVGRIELAMRKVNGSFISDVDAASLSTVEAKLIWKLNGMPNEARQILEHPESRPTDPAVAQYAASLRENGGRSLSLDQMVELAKRLKFYTSQVHREVGGPEQVAIFQKQQAVSVEQQKFPEPPKPPFGFSLIVASYFSGANAIVFAKGVSVVCVRCSWTGTKRELDGQYFVGNDFTDSVLIYDGGVLNFGDTNTVTNSTLILGPHVKRGDETARRLAKAFKWSRILQAVEKTSP